MRFWIQKFGGTSLSTREARSHAIAHVKRALAEDVRPVVVVSAMGRRGDPYATDTLIDWIQQAGGESVAREMDLLMSCGEIISAVTFSAALRAESISSVVLIIGLVIGSIFGIVFLRGIPVGPLMAAGITALFLKIFTFIFQHLD